MTHAIYAATLAALALAGCTTVQPRAATGAELLGRTMRVELPGGEVSTLRFSGDGTVIGTGTGPGPQATGRWTVEAGRICMEWPRVGRECYPYSAPFDRGRTVTLTGTSGVTVQATLQ